MLTGAPPTELLTLRNAADARGAHHGGSSPPPPDAAKTGKGKGKAKRAKLSGTKDKDKDKPDAPSTLPPPVEPLERPKPIGLGAMLANDLAGASSLFLLSAFAPRVRRERRGGDLIGRSVEPELHERHGSAERPNPHSSWPHMVYVCRR